MDEVDGAGDRAVDAAAADEGDALETAGFPCHSFVPLRRLGASGVCVARLLVFGLFSCAVPSRCPEAGADDVDFGLPLPLIFFSIYNEFSLIFSI